MELVWREWRAYVAWDSGAICGALWYGVEWCYEGYCGTEQHPDLWELRNV